MEKVTIKGFKVYQAINAVQMALFQAGGIGKNQQNQQQRYKFRGIDDVLNALSPLLAKYGLVIMPEVLGREVSERTNSKGNPLFYVTVKVKFTLISSEDGSSHDVVVYGESMDSGDKATNKAMSAAYKYMAIQSFCIATEGDNDADNTTHNLSHQNQNQPPHRPQQRRQQPQNQPNRGGYNQQPHQQTEQHYTQQAQPVQDNYQNNPPEAQQQAQYMPPDKLQMILQSLREVGVGQGQFNQVWQVQHPGQLTDDRFDDVMNWIYATNDHQQQQQRVA